MAKLTVIDGSDGVWCRPVAYEVTVWPEDAFDDPARAMNAATWCITVARVTGFEGIRWGIYRGDVGSRVCLSRSGQWDREPIPSSRTDEWLATHRFELYEALQLAREHAPKVTINGYTAAELAAEHKAHGDGWPAG